MDPHGQLDPNMGSDTVARTLQLLSRHTFVADTAEKKEKKGKRAREPKAAADEVRVGIPGAHGGSSRRMLKALHRPSVVISEGSSRSPGKGFL